MVQLIDSPAMKQTEPHQEKFERFEKEAKHPSWVFPVRKAGMARFAELGFPSVQHEDWRFTNVAGLAKLPFRPVFQPTPEVVNGDTVARFAFNKLNATRLVFLNGHYSPSLSGGAPVAPGVTVTSLAAALNSDSKLLQDHLTRHANSEEQAFTALNNAFFQDGAFVHIPAGVKLENPVHLLHISTVKEPGTTVQPRTLVVSEKGSEGTVVESYVSTGGGTYFTNSVLELVLDDGAVLEHVKLQDESLTAYHIAAIHAQLGRSANLASHSIALGAHLSRNNIRTVLGGEGVDCILNGLYVTKGQQLADHHMVVEHAQPHCNSHEYFNGILDGKSKGVFHGRILVRQAAQKTDAKQTNKNLLLSEDATVDTKPQLEIYADDVKCTHGATVGQLNEESIFYLRARGIGEETARRMLIHAFAGEIIERIRNREVREELDKLVWDRLEANPHVGQPEK